MKPTIFVRLCIVIVYMWSILWQNIDLLKILFCIYVKIELGLPIYFCNIRQFSFDTKKKEDQNTFWKHHGTITFGFASSIINIISTVTFWDKIHRPYILLFSDFVVKICNVGIIHHTQQIRWTGIKKFICRRNV